jgi:hypothetical protein
MVYDSKTDKLVPTDDFLAGRSEVLKNIAKNLVGYSSSEDILRDIRLRAEGKQIMLDIAEQMKMPELLEAHFVVKMNKIFANVYEQHVPKNEDDVKEFVKTLRKEMTAVADRERVHTG